MKLKNLAIRNLPGICPGFSLASFDPGLNLIIGSNGIGKSSLIRALRYLIVEPSPKDPKALSLEAIFEDQAGHIEVIRNGSEVVWKRGGKPTTRPVFDSKHLHYYWMSMHSLIQVGHHQNAYLVQRIEQALTGGYDLHALAEREGFKPKPRAGKEESKELKKACEKRRQVEGQHAALYAKEKQLKELNMEIKRAEEAAIRGKSLDLAIDLSRQLEKIKTCETNLALFPPHMCRLTGKESACLDDLESKKNRLKEHIQKGEQTLLAAEDQLKEICFDQRGGLDLCIDRQEEIEIYQSHLSKAHLEKEKMDQLGEKLMLEKNKQKLALTLLQKDLSQKMALPAPCLTVEEVQRAENFSRKLSLDGQTLCELRAQIAAIDGAEKPLLDEKAQLAQCQRGILTLHAWLGACAAKQKNKKWIVAICAANLLSLMLSFKERAWVLLAPAALSFFGCLGALVKKKSDLSTKARREFEEIGLEKQIAKWTETEVRRSLQALYEQCDSLRDARRRLQMKVPLLEKVKQIEARNKRWKQERECMAKRCGFDPAITTLGFDHFIRIVWDYQNRVDAIDYLTDSMNTCALRIEKYHRKVQCFLKQWGMEKELDQDVLLAALQKLNKDLNRAKAMYQQIDQLETVLARDKKELLSTDTQINQIYSEAGLRPGSAKTLIESLSQLEKWRDLTQLLNDYQVLAQEYQEKLRTKDEELIEKARKGDQKELVAEKEQCLRQIAKKEMYIAVKAGIQKEIEKAEESDQLERATQEQMCKQSKLEQIGEEQLFAEAAQFLLKEVQTKHQTENHIPIVENTKKFFTRFTCNKWQVEFARSGLFIKEVNKGAMRSLEELSSGTHVQLFLAIRFAWMKQLELSSSPLPIFLDEALLPSDGERFGAIAQTLLTLAKQENRQIFYLAARSDEPLYWKQKVNVAPYTLDLDPIRAL